MFPSRHFFNGEEISREMKLCYARRLLLGFGKGCPCHGIQVTGPGGGGGGSLFKKNKLLKKMRGEV